MALYLKQDFTPPILSRKWIAIKLRPNMQLYSRQHVISILESGLLFREDSIEVEQETPEAEVWGPGSGAVWLTAGERALSAAALCVCLAVFPLQFGGRARSNVLRLAGYACLPLCVRALHRRRCAGSLGALLARQRDYLALARRAAACLRDHAPAASIGSVASVIESMRIMLCRQQSELAVTMSRASSALLGNAPWLRGDVAWDAGSADNLMKIHHAFLVVQSNLLKHIALAHFIPSMNARKLYKNHNERIYWIHNTLINHLIEEFTQNYEPLERMYRLLKNYGSNDITYSKKLGTAMKDSWIYSDVHSDIARSNLELKVAANKCNSLDAFLDSCALNNHEIDLEILSKDIDILITNISKCLSSAENSQLRLKKLLNKLNENDNEKHEVTEEFEEENILKIEDREPEPRDEVFYFIKTEDDTSPVQPSDVTTGPGKREKETSKMVLNELKRKLVNREDVMRERERQAIVKTNPELKNNVPEFPRQIKLEEVLERKGYMAKLPRREKHKRLFRKYKISTQKPNEKYKLRTEHYDNEKEISVPSYEANSKLNAKRKILTFSKFKNGISVTEWRKGAPKKDFLSDFSDGLSDVESEAKNKVLNESVNLNNNYKDVGDARNYRFSKRDLELSPSSSESDSDFDSCKEKQMALLRDLRKYRASRKKNYPSNRARAGSSSDKLLDEGLRPVEYSFGTGLAMASVLQVNSAVRANLPQEEIFIGSGELSEDSGNDEDS